MRSHKDIKDLKKWVTEKLQCPCGKSWIAVYPIEARWLECPACTGISTLKTLRVPIESDK